jgi:hypothetical protein
MARDDSDPVRGFVVFAWADHRKIHFCEWLTFNALTRLFACTPMGLAFFSGVNAALSPPNLGMAGPDVIKSSLLAVLLSSIDYSVAARNCCAQRNAPDWVQVPFSTH